MDSANNRPSGVLDRWFGITERGSTVRQEVLSGLATFMTMAYIIFVNPLILSNAGMPMAAVIAATCLGAAVPSLLMGLWANYPLALASGMGLNAALVAYANQPGMNWQTMMGVVILEGIIILLLVLTKVREQVMNSIPINLKRSIGVGIGLFIAFLGLQQMGWVAKGDGPVFLKHGSFAIKTTLLATAGVALMAMMLAWRVRGAILFGILGTVILSVAVDSISGTAQPLVRMPDKLVAMPDFSTFAQADFMAALKPSLLAVVFAFLITDFFDTMGTVIGIGGQGGFLDKNGHLPRLNRVLAVDSFAAIWGGLCGASSATTYIESAAGVSQGGRTGLVSVVVAALFSLALFFSPIIGMVPAVATAPALLIVGFLMASALKEMDFANPEEGLPAFFTMLLIPLGQSISFGIGMGIISYVIVRVLRGKGREVSLWLYAIAALFLASFIWGL
ncbi:MAG TPA: NCS2 family permease [Verrucomicrobiae bacterium]